MLELCKEWLMFIETLKGTPTLNKLFYIQIVVMKHLHFFVNHLKNVKKMPKLNNTDDISQYFTIGL